MKHKKHNSHYIFALLGLLILLFLIIFGTRYFQSQYSFETLSLQDGQSYDDGINTQNPFKESIKITQKENKPFVGESLDTTIDLYDTFSLDYPSDYRFFNEEGDLHRITADVGLEDCESIVNEEKRIFCQNKNMISPNIFINKINADNEGFFEENAEAVVSGGLVWKQFIFQSEFGVLNAYRATINNQEFEISMISADSPSGSVFTPSESYLLDSQDQAKLLNQIVKSIRPNKNNE